MKAYTYQTRPFAGTVVTDPETRKRRIKVEHPAYYEHEIGKFKEGEEVTMIVTNKRPKRTLAQNSYYWGVYLPMIGAETGEKDLDSLHNLFKGKFLTKGIKKILGHDVRVTKSTADLSAGEFSDYIASIYQLTGVQPPPTTNFIVRMK